MKYMTVIAKEYIYLLAACIVLAAAFIFTLGIWHAASNTNTTNTLQPACVDPYTFINGNVQSVGSNSVTIVPRKADGTEGAPVTLPLDSSTDIFAHGPLTDPKTYAAQVADFREKQSHSPIALFGPDGFEHINLKISNIKVGMYAQAAVTREGDTVKTVRLDLQTPPPSQ